MNAPGCFGSPTAITPGEGECAACPAFMGCLQKARECLAEIEDEIGAGAVTRVWRKLSIGEAKQKNAKPQTMALQRPKARACMVKGTLPVKSQKLVERLCETGLDHRKLLQGGVNPFENAKPAFLRVVGNYLLAGGFTKKDLKSAFVNELSWGEKTAASHVSLSLPALDSLGIIEECEGRFTIKGAS